MLLARVWQSAGISLEWMEKCWQMSTGRKREAAGMGVSSAGKGWPELVGLLPGGSWKLMLFSVILSTQLS